MLEGDDDAVSLLQEKEIDNLAGEPQTQKRSGKEQPSHYKNSEISITSVCSTFPSKTFYIQRQVGQNNVQVYVCFCRCTNLPDNLNDSSCN